MVSRRAGFRAGWRFRSFLGPLSAHSWTARCGPSPPAAGRCGPAVCRCRESRSVAHLFVKRRGRFAAGPAWLVKEPRAGSDGRTYLLRHRRIYTDSPCRAATRMYTAGPWDSGRVSRGCISFATAGSDGRTYLLRHRRLYTDSPCRAATRKYTAGPWDSGRVSRGAWQLVLALARLWRWSTPPQSRQAMARHHGRPSCSAASLITPSLVVRSRAR